MKDEMVSKIGYEVNLSKEVESLAKKAESAHDSIDALRFSQAACNVANAMACVCNTPKTINNK
jgi:hypothetical protein